MITGDAAIQRAIDRCRELRVEVTLTDNPKLELVVGPHYAVWVRRSDRLELGDYPNVTLDQARAMAWQ